MVGPTTPRQTLSNLILLRYPLLLESCLMRISTGKCWLRNTGGYAWLMRLFWGRPDHLVSLRNAEHRVAQRSYSSTRENQIIDHIVLQFASNTSFKAPREIYNAYKARGNATNRVVSYYRSDSQMECYCA
jgi:hypothetical protein